MNKIKLCNQKKKKKKKKRKKKLVQQYFVNHNLHYGLNCACMLFKDVMTTIRKSYGMRVKLKCQVVMLLYKAIIQLRQCFPVIIQGETPLHSAARNGNGNCCSILLSAGSNVDCTTENVIVWNILLIVFWNWI